jgi:hypothetical protein
MSKALLIDVHNRMITETTVTDLEQIQKLLHGHLEVAYQFDTGDVLYVDEEGLYKPNQQYFHLHQRPDQALAGNGLLVGREAPPNWFPADVVLTIAELRTWIRFLQRAPAQRFS